MKNDEDRISSLRTKMWFAQDNALYFLEQADATSTKNWDKVQLWFQRAEMIKVLLKDFEERK